MKTSDQTFSFKRFKNIPGIGIILEMTSGFMYSLAILNLKLVTEISPALFLVIQALIQWRRSAQKERGDSSVRVLIAKSLEEDAKMHLCRYTTVDMKTSDQTFSFKKFKTVPGIGIILGMTSEFMYFLAILNLKLVSEISPAQFLVTKALIPWEIYNVFIIYSKVNYIGEEGERIILFFRAIFRGIVKALMIYCVHWLPLADASTIYSSSPVFISLLAHLVLREPCGAYNVFVLMLTMTGIVLIIRPTFIVGTFQDIHDVDNRWREITIGCSACLLKACCYTMARKLQKTPSQVAAAMMFTFSLVVGYFLVFLFDEIQISSCGRNSVLVVSFGIFMMLNQLLTTMALQVENAGPVSVAQSLNIIIAFLFDFHIKYHRHLYSICGAVLILLEFF
ncbi:solute carrier family 35 member G1-like [Tachypleus tridentatus]|uniref:solute carrier family 35 member G1-like n=1 Tax=Tachypleus tridentatus TaxID=6853 RepID=UPI003FCF5DB2